jgi:hypothetical protein
MKTGLVSVLLIVLVMIVGSVGREASQGEACLRVEGDFQSVDTAHSVSAADLNQDGHLDLAVVAHFPVTFAEAGAIFLGDGRGQFTFLTHIPIGDHNHGVALTDLNHDDHLDLVTSTADIQGRETEYDVIHTFLGDGTGRSMCKSAI